MDISLDWIAPRFLYHRYEPDKVLKNTREVPNGHAGRVQKIRDEGQCRRPGGRRDHRRRVRTHRRFARAGRHHAPDQQAVRRPRFRQLLHSAQRPAVRPAAGRGQESGRRARVRQLLHDLAELHHPRVRDLPDGAPDEPPAQPVQQGRRSRSGRAGAAAGRGRAAARNPRRAEAITAGVPHAPLLAAVRANRHDRPRHLCRDRGAAAGVDGPGADPGRRRRAGAVGPCAAGARRRSGAGQLPRRSRPRHAGRRQHPHEQGVARDASAAEGSVLQALFRRQDAAAGTDGQPGLGRDRQRRRLYPDELPR
ncbi:conserved hypothetical protein, partial [Ricinus communis]